MKALVKVWQKPEKAPPMVIELEDVTFKTVHAEVMSLWEEAKEKGYVRIQRLDGGAIIPFDNISTITYKIIDGMEV